MPTKKLAALGADGGEITLLQYFTMCGVWSLTTYDACDLRCSYCISYAQGPSLPRFSADEVVDRLRTELRSVPADGTIGIGGLIDGYVHAEAEHGITRAALRELVAQGRRIVIVTKGTLIERDIDILRNHPDVSVNVSLPSLDDEVLRLIEPKCATAGARLATIEKLAAAGIQVQLHAQPWIPGMTDALRMVELAAGRYDVSFGPLNVQSPTVASTRLGRRFTQAEINEAYVREMKRVGPREGVTWQRPPWLGEELRAISSRWRQPVPDDWVAGDRWGPPPGDASGDVRAEDRNAAVVARIIGATTYEELAATILDLVSPHARWYQGRFPTRDLASEGPDAARAFTDVVAALDEEERTVDHITPRGTHVEARYRLRGRTRTDFRDWPADTALEVVVEATYRFDQNHLVVEQWQDHEVREMTADASVTAS